MNEDFFCQEKKCDEIKQKLMIYTLDVDKRMMDLVAIVYPVKLIDTPIKVRATLVLPNTVFANW
jgi:hypothetical protein